MSNRHIEAGNRGHSYIWEQRWEEAVREFEFAISGRPNEADLYDGLATAYRNLNQLEKALDHYQTAARLSKGDPIYLEQVADIQQKLGRYKPAAQTFMAIGEMRLRERRLDDAIDKWLLAARLDPNLLTAHQRLAAIYQRQNKSFQALNEYLEVARLYEEAGEPDKALEACRIALELDPSNPDVITAIELLEGGNRAFANSKPRSSSAGGASVIGGSSDQAGRRVVVPLESAKQMARERLAEEIFSADDVDAAGQMQRMAAISQALDYQTRGMIDEAISGFEQAIKSGMRSPSSFISLGLLYLESRRFDEAIDLLRQSVDAPEYRLAGHFALGEAYRAQNDSRASIDHFVSVAQILDLATVPRESASDMMQQYKNLGQSLKSSRERDRAITFSNALIDLLCRSQWEIDVQQARERLDAMSASPGAQILGNILTAGSPRVLDALYVAREHANQGLHDTAIEEIYRAIELSPSYMPTHQEMAEVLLKQNRIEQATEKFLMIGSTYSARQDVYGAIQAYRRAVDVSPLDMQTRNQLIGLLKENGQNDLVIEQFLGMGESYYQMAQVDRARQAYIEGMKLAARGNVDSSWRIKLLQRIGDIDTQRFDWRQALPIFRELRRLAPNDERVAQTLIDLYFKTGDSPNAVRELDRFLVQLAKGGKGSKLQGLLEELVEQRPSEPGLVDRLVRLYMQQQRKDDAIKLLDRLGEQQLDAGHNEAAVVTIEKILSLKPTDESDYRQLLSQIKG